MPSISHLAFLVCCRLVVFSFVSTKQFSLINQIHRRSGDAIVRKLYLNREPKLTPPQVLCTDALPMPQFFGSLGQSFSSERWNSFHNRLNVLGRHKGISNTGSPVLPFPIGKNTSALNFSRIRSRYFHGLRTSMDQALASLNCG